MYLKLVLFLEFVFLSSQAPIKSILHDEEAENEDNFRLLLQEIMLKNLQPYKCVVILCDEVYGTIFAKTWFASFGPHITFIVLHVEAYEDLLSPDETKKAALTIARNEGCQMYIIFLANGLQAARFLQFGDRYRMINTRMKFVVLFDNRIFEKHLLYLWKRIINVVFIRRFGGQKDEGKPPWFEITTVPFPSQISTVYVPKRLDIWTKLKFRKGVDLFRDKTSDLKNQTLRVAAFNHIPATTKVSHNQNTARAFIGNFSGMEIEILHTVATAMNFQCEVYEPLNAESELWGSKQTGLIGEMVNTKADIALGDLYYTPYFLNLMDLSVPYNTECLTFLTPESLTNNSWKILILPFKPMMWTAVLICLFISGLIFHFLARFHEGVSQTKIEEKKKLFKPSNKIITLSLFADKSHLNPDAKYALMKEQYQTPKLEGEPVGLYQFSEPFNSFLYTYSMLLLVSLPKLPSGWSLRMLTGWYWLYALLLVVAYKASMTAILAKPPPRVTVNTFEELIKSGLKCGGRGDVNREFFTSSLDYATNQIGEKFEMVNSTDEAVDRVARGEFAFYENSYFLKEALVKRQERFRKSRSNHTNNKAQKMREIAKEDRNLHIMTDCVIQMPISIGLQKNSPIKPRMDKYIRKVLEAGLVNKWLNDVMTVIFNSEIQGTAEIKALMNMQKFFGAIVALFIGYAISVIALLIEIFYFHYFVKKNPHYNKYSMTITSDKKAE